MHAPASVPGARRRLALPSALRRTPKLPGGRPALMVAGGLSGMLLLLAIILVYTPIAHPRTTLVDGVTGPSEARITRLLEDAASKQSTFAVDDDALMRAVAAYPEVSGVQVNADPPFHLEVRALMRPPVARVDIAGRAFVVAADGTILQRAAEADVPKLDATVGSVTIRDGHVVGGRRALGVLSGAPEELLAIARTVRITHAGVEVEMARGPRLIFGTAEHAAEKWAAAAAVIADGSAQGATYIDLRVPARPAVGGLGGSKSATASEPPQLTATQATGTTTTVTSTPAPSASTTGTTTATPPAGTATQSAPAANAGTTTGTQTQGPTTGASTAPSTGTASPSTGTSTGAQAPAQGTGGAAIGATP